MYLSPFETFFFSGNVSDLFHFFLDFFSFFLSIFFENDLIFLKFFGFFFFILNFIVDSFFFYSNGVFFFKLINLVFVFLFFYFFFFFVFILISTSNKLNDFFIKPMEQLFISFLNMIRAYLGIYYKSFFPFFFFLFIFIGFLNIFGMVPYSFALTSHFFITFSVALVSWFTVLFIGFSKYRLSFFSLFVPSGVPFWLLPFICLIELISYFFRVISLALRLFANIVAGHILLELLLVFIDKFLFNNVSIFSFLFVFFFLFFFVVMVFFELFICLLQAYIFTLLCLIYLSELLGPNAHL